MPLSRYDTEPVRRPSGLVPPVVDISGTTELRLHGVGGTTPADLLGDVAPQQASGDRIAGFYRTADVAGRHVEAYSWGGLTSRSGTRVLWLLLFPFALANMAGWMCTPQAYASPWRFRLHRTAVRWAALALTGNLLLIIAMTSMDLIGYQCGGQASCAADSWALHLLRYPALAGYPGRRVLAGALLPTAVVVLLAVLALRSIGRYEMVRPPAPVGAPIPQPAPAVRPQPSGAARATSAAQPGVGLADPRFWDGQRSALHLGCLHIGAGFAFVALALAYTVQRSAAAAGAPVTAAWCWPLVLVAGGLVVLTVAVLAAFDACPPVAPAAVLAVGVLAILAAGTFAVVQPGYDQPFGYLPGMRQVANGALGAVFGTLALTFVAALFGGWRRGMFLMFGPFVTLTISVLSLNVTLLSTMIRVGDLVGTVATRTPPPYAPAGGPELYVYPMAARVVQYLTVLPLALLLVFVCYEAVCFWRAGTDPLEQDRIRRWYRDNIPRPAADDPWQRSTVEDEQARRQRMARLWRQMAGRGWEARLARSRRVARMPHDVDVLLTAMAVIGAVLLVAIQIRYWFFHQLPWGTQWTFTVGSYLATSIPVALILVLRRGWSNLTSRRRIGIIWDITTFWPRAYHPLAPPSYPERAVPELQRRLWWIHDNGGRVVVAAHSQGTVLAAAALLQTDNRPNDDVVALVTFGSPLRKLYGWAFPAYFGDDVLRRLGRAGEEPGGPVHAWRNFYYLTDPIGGPALAPETGTEVDVELPDPASSWYVYGQPEPSATRHSGYWADAAVWREVDRLAGLVATADRIPRPRAADATS